MQKVRRRTLLLLLHGLHKLIQISKAQVSLACTPFRIRYLSFCWLVLNVMSGFHSALSVTGRLNKHHTQKSWSTPGAHVGCLTAQKARYPERQTHPTSATPCRHQGLEGNPTQQGRLRGEYSMAFAVARLYFEDSSCLTAHNPQGTCYEFNWVLALEIIPSKNTLNEILQVTYTSTIIATSARTLVHLF